VTAGRKDKHPRKPLRIELSRPALVGWSLGLVLALLWMFLLGLFLGKGITLNNIDFAELRKRMISEELWPDSGTNENPSRLTETREEISTKDLDFYRALDRKKEARLRDPQQGDDPVPDGSGPAAAAPPAASPRPKAPGSGSEDGRPATCFTVQLASFRDRDSARKFAARLGDLEYPATIRSIELSERGRWYRVQVGELPTRAEAGVLARRLSEEYHLEGFVIRLDLQP
jgi:cell division protein FtsN